MKCEMKKNYDIDYDIDVNSHNETMCISYGIYTIFLNTTNNVMLHVPSNDALILLRPNFDEYFVPATKLGEFSV